MKLLTKQFLFFRPNDKCVIAKFCSMTLIFSVMFRFFSILFRFQFPKHQYILLLQFWRIFFGENPHVIEIGKDEGRIMRHCNGIIVYVLYTLLYMTGNQWYNGTFCKEKIFLHLLGKQVPIIPIIQGLKQCRF